MDALQANKVLTEMKGKPLEVRYPMLSEQLRMVGYHDVSWGNGEEGKTIGGWSQTEKARVSSIVD